MPCLMTLLLLVYICVRSIGQPIYFILYWMILLELLSMLGTATPILVCLILYAAAKANVKNFVVLNINYCRGVHTMEF